MNGRMKRQSLAILIVIIGVTATTTIAYYFFPAILVESPKFGMPAFRRPGETLTVNVSLPTPLPTDPSLTTVSLKGKWGHFDLTVQGVAANLEGFHWKSSIMVTIPSGVLPGLYNLSVTTGTLTLDEPHAVQVVDAYKQSIRIAHISDVHVTADSNEHLPEIIQEINLLHPDMLLCSGDVADLAMRVEWDRAYACFLALEVPLVTVLGNHDLGNVNVFYELFASDYYSLDYGPYFHITAFNSGDKYTSPQRVWPCWDFLTTDLAGAQGAAQRILLFHIPPYDKDGDFNMPGQEISAQFNQLVADTKVGLLLVGHQHDDVISNCTGQDITSLPAAGPVVIQTRDSDHYRIIEMNTIVGVVNATYDPFAKGLPDSIKVGNLTYALKSNDISGKNFTLQVNNSLFTQLTRCQYTFTVSNANTSQYVALGGAITQVATVENKWIISVSFDLPKQALTNITVQEGP